MAHNIPNSTDRRQERYTDNSPRTPPLLHTVPLICPPAPKKPARKPKDFAKIDKRIPAPRFVEQRSKILAFSEGTESVAKIAKPESKRSRVSKSKIPPGFPPRRSERLLRRKLRLNSIARMD